MNTIIEISRWIRTLFGIRYVILVCFDGSTCVRPIFWRGGRPMAAKYRWIGSDSMLFDGGKVSAEPSYVTRWEPYTPLAAKRWPEPPGEVA